MKDHSAARTAVNSLMLAEGLQERGKSAWHSPSFDDAAALLRAEVRRGDAVLIMGAGDIYRLADDLIK